MLLCWCVAFVTAGLLHSYLFSYTEFSIFLSSMVTQLTGQHQY